MEENKSIFNELIAVDVKDHIEKKGNLNYLSWVWAWIEIKKRYPNATYEVEKFENDLPYVYDKNTGYMVFTKVCINGLTHEMHLPVMDYKNKAIKENCTMFEINKTIMRCLTKNLAMFGLGLNIYAGEDIPEDFNQQNQNNNSKVQNQQNQNSFSAKQMIDAKLSLEAYISSGVLDQNPKFKSSAQSLLQSNDYKRILDAIAYCQKTSEANYGRN